MSTCGCNTNQNGVSGNGSISSEFKQFLNITTSDNTNVKVFENFIYNIKYYDADSRTIVDLKGIVTGFGGSSSNPSIMVTYRKEDISVSYQGNTCKPVCNSYCKYYKYCFKLMNGQNVKTVTKCPMTSDGADTEKYEVIGSLTISVANIYAISLVVENTPTHINVSATEKDEVKIVLLGICSTQIRTMFINMKFIDDQSESAFKEVNLKIGNRYKVVYADKKNPVTNGCDCGNIYELEGTLTNIEEVCCCTRDTDTSYSIVRTVNCDHPEEIVGLHNSIYAACDVSTDKDKFLSGEPVKSDFKLTFDTTDIALHGTHDTILLSQIRDIDILPGGSENNSCDCDCCTKWNSGSVKQFFTAAGKEFVYDNGLIYEKDEDDCCSYKYRLEDILTFYFSE